MNPTTDTSKPNGAKTIATPDDGSEPIESANGYTVRDLILFQDHTIAPVQNAPHNKHIIRIVPPGNERVLIARIFMHKTAAESLVLERFTVGMREISKGAGTCDIFLATIPNWTPQNLYIDHDNPLVMLVSNVRNFPIRTVGQVVVLKKA